MGALIAMSVAGLAGFVWALSQIERKETETALDALDGDGTTASTAVGSPPGGRREEEYWLKHEDLVSGDGEYDAEIALAVLYAADDDWRERHRHGE